MGNFIETLLTLICFPIAWVIFTIPFLLHIRLEAKKKWKKNVETYPFFHYPFYKKIFLVGLRGVINPVVVVATCIFNISIVIFTVLSIWQLISPNIYIVYCIRAITGVYGISLFVKLCFYSACPPRF